MAFTIKIQKNNSESNRMNKDLTDIKTVTGTLKQSTSILSPVIFIKADITDLTDCNYMTIDAFNRSYFVTNIASIRNGLVEISASVDTISSFKDEIRQCTGIVKKQENKWNLYIDDSTFAVYQNPLIQTKYFPSGFESHSFVLAVSGS